MFHNSCSFETHIIQGLWWSTEPQGGAREDRESFPDIDFNLFMCKFFFIIKVRAFLIEEQKIVMKVLKAQGKN